MAAQLEAGSSRAGKVRMMVSADGIDGVGTSYSSFMPSYRDAKISCIIMGYNAIRPACGDLGSHPKFAIAQSLCDAQKLSSRALVGTLLVNKDGGLSNSGDQED
jgi:hypothetical protein